ncbi:MAG: hypothetical protein C0501_07900 [Isosphaera sp.]|nr:hypothetical protein [Isosphaera sp.]
MDTHELVLASAPFADLVRRLAAGADRVRAPCGLSRLADRWEWLVGRSEAEPADRPGLVAVRAAHPEVLGEAVRAAAADARVVLGVGVGAAAGHLAGLVRLHGQTWPLAAVRVVAPGLPRLDLRPGPAGGPDGPTRERFSRTIGALGEAAFARLRALRFAVVGCGRTGSLVADHVAGYGVAGLALIDPDVVEPHNLGEMAGGLDGSVGRGKAEAVAERLRRGSPAGRVSAVAAPVESLDALFALKAADVVVSCPDNPAARVATARVAALYLKPVLDLGTGVVRGPGGRQAGVDVRWLLPGRCAGCVGGGDGSGAVAPRLGSLRSLNTWAVGLGFTLVEQFLTRRRSADSVWLQGDLSGDGLPGLLRPMMPADRDCRVCRARGDGDDGLTSPGVGVPTSPA